MQHQKISIDKEFEYLVSMETGTFSLDMAPPSFFDDEPFMTKLDVGIDHINLNKTLVIQTKHYTRKSIDFADFAKFHAAVDCMQTLPAMRLIATLEESAFTKNVMNAMQCPNMPKYEIRRFNIQELRDKHNVVKSLPSKKANICERRPSQLRVIENIQASDADTFTLQAPPGWGKTFVCLSIIREVCENHPDCCVVVLVNTLDIVRQTHKNFRDNKHAS